jgi:hypothetical protein
MQRAILGNGVRAGLAVALLLLLRFVLTPHSILTDENGLHEPRIRFIERVDDHRM